MSLTKVTYSMIENAYLDVKNYGAVGDGITDDTSAIQLALNEMVSYSKRALYFPPGKYLITSTLTPIVGITSAEFIGASGYDGVRGPINDSLRTELIWGGLTDATKPIVKFNKANGVVWRGISLNCNYKAGYGLQFMSSTITSGSIKNIVENCSVHYALRDGIIVGEDGNPTAAPGDRQFFGNVFRNLTMYGCARSAIHINEWNADQQMFDTVMVYLDDALVPQNTLNAFWFDHGGQQSVLLNCQSGGINVVPGIPSSGFAIKNKADDSSPYSTTGGAFGLSVIGFWNEGAGGLYYGVTSTSDGKAFVFDNCRSFTSNTANRSVYIDKGTSDQIPYTFLNCSFLSDIEIVSSSFQKQSLSIINCFIAPGGFLIGPGGVSTTIQGLYTQVGITSNTLTIPRFASTIVVTADANINSVFTEGVSKQGDVIVIIYTQDGVGGRTVNWTSTGQISLLPNPPQPNVAAGAKSTYTFVSDGSKYFLTSVINT